MVKVTPAGGAENAKVQPACRRAYSAEPAYTQGDWPAPTTGAQSPRARLQYSAVKRMNMRWPVPLPGMLALTPIALGAPAVSQMFTVAHSSGVSDFLAIP